MPSKSLPYTISVVPDAIFYTYAHTSGKTDEATGSFEPGTSATLFRWCRADEKCQITYYRNHSSVNAPLNDDSFCCYIF